MVELFELLLTRDCEVCLKFWFLGSWGKSPRFLSPRQHEPGNCFSPRSFVQEASHRTYGGATVIKEATVNRFGLANGLSDVFAVGELRGTRSKRFVGKLSWCVIRRALQGLLAILLRGDTAALVEQGCDLLTVAKAPLMEYESVMRMMEQVILRCVLCNLDCLRAGDESSSRAVRVMA